jgi:ADP-ribose pyrophosphatase
LSETRSFRTLERRPVYKGRVVDLSVERVETPTGHVTDLELIRHPGAAAVVPVTDDGEVLLVRQYRHATRSWLLEVPAGKLDSGEAPEVCAVREVEEEVGYRARKLVPLGWIWTTPGFTDEKIWLFLARDLVEGRQALEADEILDVVRMPYTEALSCVERGEICDGKSVCALLLARSFLAGPSPDRL